MVAKSNDLYLAVLPLIHITPVQTLGYGLTEQTLTLFPDRAFATEFFEDEVDTYVDAFEARTKYLVGGHVTKFECSKEAIGEGRVIVRVTQYVQ